MVQPMTQRLALSLLVTLGLSSVINVGAYATPIQAKPLPSKAQAARGDKDFDNSVEAAPPLSRFHRRMDYREAEKQKAADDEAAKKDAVAAAAKARADQLAAVKKHSAEAMEANNRGVALGQQKRFLEAIAEHEKAVQMEPTNKQFRINLSAARCAFGQEKFAAGDYSSASNLFRKALAAASDNGLAGKMLVQSLKKQGRDPNNVDARIEMGDQLCATGDLEGAAVEYQAAMQLEPCAKTYVKMGDIALRYGQYQTGANWYSQAIVKDPNYGPANRQLGLLQLALHDSTGAAASLRKAVVLDSHDVAAGKALVDIWRRQVAANPLLAENHLGLAGAMQLTGDFVGADSEYRKLQALDPKNPGLEAGLESLSRARQHAEAEHYREAAQTLFGQGLQREALAQIGRAVNMEPRNSKYQFLFAQCLEANGDINGAHQAYLTCVLLDPEHNQDAAARMRMMQTRYGNQINVQQQAAQVADRFAGQRPQGAAPQAMAAPGMVPQQNAVRQPVSAQQPIAQSAPADSAFNDALSKVTDLESQKNYEEAISLLRQIVNRNLQSAETHHRLAVDLLAAGQIDESISEFRMASALRPDKKEYAGDLARAMEIHKRSLASDNTAAGVAR